MAALTPISRKPASVYVTGMAIAGALAGLLVGTSQGSGLLGLIAGAALMAAVAYVMAQIIGNESATRWALVAILAVAGFFLGGVSAAVIGALFGWFFGWFGLWLYEGRYRAKLVPYLTPSQVFWHYAFRVLCGAIFVFLITPIIVVMPLSFNAEDFFTFTPEMLRLDPDGYSLKHYRDFFTNRS